MSAKKPLTPYSYAIADFIGAAVSWGLFYLWRRQEIFSSVPLRQLVREPMLSIGLFFLPLFWLMLFALSGSYRTSMYQRSRLNEMTATFITSLTGCIVLFFVLLIDDIRFDGKYSYYYKAFFLLLGLHFLLTFFARNVLLLIAKAHIRTGKVKMPVLFVGNNAKTVKAFEEVSRKSFSNGMHPAGFVTVNGVGKNGLVNKLDYKGQLDNIETIIEQHGIEQVIIAFDKGEQYLTASLINRLSEKDVGIKLVPDSLDILYGSVKTNNVLGDMFIDIQTGLMPVWQLNIKRLLDVMVSLFAMLLLWPLALFVIIRLRLSSAGPVLYSQERIGYKGKPFQIFKFRSMYVDAEKDGPALSSDYDPRITGWGRTMRKWRAG